MASLSLVLHGLVLGGLVTLWQGASRPARAPHTEDSALVLRLMASPPPPAPARAAAPAKTTARRPRPFKVALPRPPPATPRPPAPVAPETGPETPATPGAETSVADAVAATAHGPSDAAPGATPGGEANGIIGGMVRGVLAASSAGMLPVAPPPPSATERAAWEEEYFEAMFRDRFEDVRYPHQAAAAGIEGQFSVRISVDARGRLVALSVVGTCPHHVLCDAALAAVREAAPFPPPPAALGTPVTVELPFNYHLR